MSINLDKQTLNLVKALMIVLIVFLIVSMFCLLILTITNCVIYSAIVDMITNVHTIVNH